MAMTLADIRAKYPDAYKNVDDATLADAIYKKHYPTADRREFDARIGLKPYDNMATTALKAAQGVPGNIQVGISGVAQQLAEGEAGDPNALIGRMAAPDFRISQRPDIDETNLIQWGRAKLGLDTSTPLTPEQTAEIEGLAKAPGAREEFAQYLRDGEGIGTSPMKVALADVKGQLERAQIEKTIPQLDVSPGSPESIAGNVVSSIGQMAPGYVASIVTRNPGPAVALAEVLTTSQAYAEARDAGVAPDKAAQYAMASGFAEAVGEALPLSMILEEGGKLIPKLFKAGVSEALQESVTQLIQSGLQSGTINPDMTWKDVKDQVIAAAATGAVTGVLLGGATAGLDAAKGKPTAESVSAEVLAQPEAEDPIEDSVALPTQTLLALPSPEMFAQPEIQRRHPAAMPEQSSVAEDADYQARIALKRTRQQETAELLQTARETITPLGTFSTEDIGGEAAQRVKALRIQTGRPIEAPVTVEELARAKVPQAQIDAIITARRPMAQAEALTPLDITRAASAKNIIADDHNFADLAYRTTGQRNPDRMTQAQLNALKTTIDALPAHPKPVTVPLAEVSTFTDDQYGKAVDALRKQGRYTEKAIKDVTGLKTAKDVHAIRDAMVRRGQLVQRSPNDFRLYDVVGQERQAVPADLPPGAFKEHVITRLPVSRTRLRKDGTLLPESFGSAAEVREKISTIRETESKAGGKRAALAIEPAADVAYGVMENRYDEKGNLLGQVVVDTHRNEADAKKSAEKLNNVGATSAAVEMPAAPKRKPAPPPGLAGRLDEVTKRLNKLAVERKLPLIGARVALRSEVVTPDGDTVEGMFFQNLISITTANLTADMTTDQVVDRLAQVMDHELIHALRRAGVLGPETDGWKTIVRYARRAKRPGENETYTEWANRVYAGIPGYESTEAREEEAIAEAFRHWAKARRNVAGKPATVFAQIVEWFKRLVRAVPDDLFRAIETGSMVEEALRPPGSNQPRARAVKDMAVAKAGLTAAEKAQDENLARVKGREFLRARAQAREDRLGRSGPKTVLGTTPTKAYATGTVMNREGVAAIADKYRTETGVSLGRLMTLLPEDVAYLQRIADAQQKGAHNPSANDVAKAYRALAEETRAMWRALGPIEVTAWTGDGPPYASPVEMFDDLAAGRLRIRLSRDQFGEGADNPGHPLYEASGYKTTDGKDLVLNDLLRVVHDVYGHGQSGFRDDPRGQYNAYHEHARLLSPEARRALATETLAQSAWANYGPHLRRRDGTVPRETDVDYLAPSMKEFAEQKAFLVPEELIATDPGWVIAEAADKAEDPRFMVAYHGTREKVPKFSNDYIGTGEGNQSFGWGLYFASLKEVANHYRLGLTPFDPEKHSVTYKGQMVRGMRASADPLEQAARIVGTSMEATEEPFAAVLAAAKERFMTPAVKAALDQLRKEDFVLPGRGNLYKVDIPEDEDLMAWDASVLDQPPKVLAFIEKMVGEAPTDSNLAKIASAGGGLRRDVTGEAFYHSLGNYLRSKQPFSLLRDMPRGKELASKFMAANGIPGHRYKDAGSRAAEGKGTYNYVIYDDSRVQILEENPKFSRFDDELPGGRLYGNPNRSPGGALSKPETPSPAFSTDRPGNRFFGGEMANHQLEMARTGERGATLIYISPEDFLSLTGAPANPEQEVYDAAVTDGYKFSTLPSLTIDGYAGNVRASGHDGAFAAVSLAVRVPVGGIPVVLYPKKGESLGLVTALEGADGARVPWPHDGRQENFLDEREDAGPRYSLTASVGNRVPTTPPGPMRNIVQQRTEGMIGRAIHAIGRDKRQWVPGVWSIFDARVALQDKMLSIKEMIEDIKENGGDITDLNDTYMLEQLYHGKVFEQIRQREIELQVPLLNALKAAHDGPLKIQPKQFEDYLYARHAPERNAYLRARGATQDNPAGMSDAEASAILDRFALDGKLPALEALAAMADRITANTTKTRVDAGLISEEAARSSPYQYYVPLRGFAEEDLDPGEPTENQTRARSGKGFSVGGREDRTVTGRERKAGDILGHLFLQNTEAVIRGEKNAVALSFMRLLQDNPDAGYGQILKTAPTRRVVGPNGMIHDAGDPTYRQQPDIVTAKWKGREVIARVVDPRLARAIKSDYVTNSNGLVNALNNIASRATWLRNWTRFQATINTSLNPEFFISNFARDLQTAGILSAQYDIKGMSGKVAANAPKAFAGIRAVLRGGDTSGPWAQAFMEMQKAGGTTEFLGIHDLEMQVQAIRNSVTRTGLAATPRKAMEYLSKVGKLVEDYNKVAENTLRLSAYVAAREAGVSVPQAAYLAKNLTVNFNKGGELKGFMNTAYLFFNASIQGASVLMNGLKNKRVQKIGAGVVVAGVVQDIINRMLSGDDDDNGVPDYDDIPDYVLQNNFVLMNPLGDGYLSFPMPYGLNAFYNLGRNLSAGFSGSPVRSPGKSAIDSLLGFADAFNPLGGVQSWLNFIAPTIADPVVDLLTNKDFAGNPIVPERPTFGLPVPDSQKFWSNTGDIPKGIAEQINALTGGSKDRPGTIDMSPELLQYGYDYVTGATGAFVGRLINLGVRSPQIAKGDFSDIKIGDIPFARRLVGSISERNNTARYYEVAKDIGYTALEMKRMEEGGDIEGLRALIARKPVEVRLAPLFEDAEKDLADLRKEIREVREHPTLSAERKNDIVKRLQEDQNDIMRQLNKIYFASHKAK